MATEPPLSAEATKGKRRLERTLIGVIVLAIIGLTILQTYVVRAGAGAPKVNSILVFALININVILLFFLLFLVLRNLYQIFFERQRRVIGSKLRTKLVIAFVSLSLVPTALLFFVAIQFITASHDYWFKANVEQSLAESLELNESMLGVTRHLAQDFGAIIKRDLEKMRIPPSADPDALRALLEEQRRAYDLSLVQLYSPGQGLIASAMDPEMNREFIPPMPELSLIRARMQKTPQTRLDSTGDQDLLRVAWPIAGRNDSPLAILVVGFRLPAPFKEKVEAVSRGLEGYRQLQQLQDPIRISHFIALTIVALLILFVSTWIGFHLAKGITGPLLDLAEATQRVAQGELDFSISAQSGDEIGTLVESFNQMTRDLKTGKEELTRKNSQLVESYTELDKRRRYMEIILQNVAAGVVSLSAEGEITTANHSAAEILSLNTEQVIGRRYREIMHPDHLAILDELIQSARRSPRGAAEKQVRVRIRDHVVSLHVHLTLLQEEGGREVGAVIVFDDLSDLEKAQRMAAWREVARRIAHEIKNPLTPIQLSTQRLRKRYGDRFGDDGQVFEESTQMIMRQVEALKRLVNEFSNFARLPAAEPSPNDLGEIVEETLLVYREGHRDVDFVLRKDPALPVFNIDREQMQRALINLLDNAVAAVEDKGRVEVGIAYDGQLKMARLEVADDGTGITPADKSRLFEPYFSTKKSGTGLGLAIVSTIVNDHNGFVRVQDNEPKGTRFIIELPVQS